MNTLQIEFHCLCLFVPEPEKNLVHVVMPSTASCDGGGDHGGHDGQGSLHPGGHPGGGGVGQHVHEPHVAFITHAGLTQPIRIEGWALRLGKEGGDINTNMSPERAINGARLIDLNEHTGLELPADIVLEEPNEDVSARVTLREGRLVESFADVRWRMKDELVPMASRSAWEIDDFSDTKLEWKRLTASGDPPLASLNDVPETDGVRRLHVFHTTPQGMARGRTRLTPSEVAEHFRVYLKLYRIRPEDQDSLLPGTRQAWEDLGLDPGAEIPVGDDGERSVGVDCPNGTGTPGPK